MIALEAWGLLRSGIQGHLENARAAGFSSRAGCSLLALLLSAASAFAAPAPSSPAAARGAAGAPQATRPAPPVALRLPADLVYAHPHAPDSSVVFSHQTHVAAANNRCTGCHPAVFPMLHRGPKPSHLDMNAGRSCGSCHDGKQSFGVRDAAACGTCHAGAPAAGASAGLRGASGAGSPGAGAGATTAAAPPRMPKPHAYAAGEGSPGVVTFRHKTHVKTAADCAACHPKPFRMAPAPAIPDGGMHDATACGSCHDGKRSFATDDDSKCGRCHRATGGRP